MLGYGIGLGLEACILGDIDSACCDLCYSTWSVRLYVCMYVCRLSHPCTLLKPLDGMRCHLAWTLVIFLCDQMPAPLVSRCSQFPSKSDHLGLCDVRLICNQDKKQMTDRHAVNPS